jgi:Xaa-Pro aminopeptidase
MRRAIRAAESGWSVIRRALREESGVTSEALQARVLCEIAAHDVVPYDIIIVPYGPQSAFAHAAGSGEVLAGEPLIADLCMRDRATGAYADVTRTFCLGECPAELIEDLELCSEALEAAIGAVEPGALAADLNAIASEIFERAGRPTHRRRLPGATMDEGFRHPLGHGVGLEVHEPPLLGPGSDVPLVEGEVLCIEPGLYRRGFGGCRLEDMVLVTSDGHQRLTEYDYAPQP